MLWSHCYNFNNKICLLLKLLNEVFAILILVISINYREGKTIDESDNCDPNDDNCETGKDQNFPNIQN